MAQSMETCMIACIKCRAILQSMTTAILSKLKKISDAIVDTLTNFETIFLCNSTVMNFQSFMHVKWIITVSFCLEINQTTKLFNFLQWTIREKQLNQSTKAFNILQQTIRTKQFPSKLVMHNISNALLMKPSATCTLKPVIYLIVSSVHLKAHATLIFAHHLRQSLGDSNLSLLQLQLILATFSLQVDDHHCFAISY